MSTNNSKVYFNNQFSILFLIIIILIIKIHDFIFNIGILIKIMKGCDNMQTISGKILKSYSKFMGQIITRNNKKIGNEKFLTKEIIDNLKQAEREIDNGEGILLDDFIKGLRNKYEY